MTAAYFEDHPTDPDKVILRKPTMMWEGSLHIVCECDKCKAQSEQKPMHPQLKAMLKNTLTNALLNQHHSAHGLG